jgi:hypothetical protein
MRSPAAQVLCAFVLVASLGACKGRSTSASPAVWEPVDEKFQGCEGG